MSNLTSLRRRVDTIADIHEEFMERYKRTDDGDDLEKASKQVQVIDDMVNPRKGMAGFAMNLQINQYSEMPLDEIRAKRLELLKKMEHVKMNLNKDIEIKAEPPNEIK
jgi:hypothetical protein